MLERKDTEMHMLQESFEQEKAVLADNYREEMKAVQ